MAKAANKTVATKASVKAFLDAVEDDARRADAKALDKMMREISGEKPAMWGPAIVGYGRYHYRYDSGREGDFMKLGFSPRKANLVIYIMPGFEKYDALLKKLGRHKTGRSCLYINRLADVDQSALRELAARAWKHMSDKYG